MQGTSYLLDSNILLRWVQPRDVTYSAAHEAVEALQRQRARMCYTSQNLGEFWNVCTRPNASNGFGLMPSEADLRARSFESQFLLLEDNREIHRRWRRLLVEYQVSGVQVHDARLVASMLVYGIEYVITFNARDFVRYSGITAVHPAEV
jgi:predicted nucleic acid-binding protein